jgi:hypothetical protein
VLVIDAGVPDDSAETDCSLRIEPFPLDFGSVVIGSTKTRGFTFTDTGTSECLVSDISLAAGCSTAFSMPEGPIVSQRLSPPGQSSAFPNSINFVIAFTPPSVGTFDCSLQAFDVAGRGSQLKGQGIE